MTHKTFFQTSGVIFLAVAILHLLRILSSWEASINGWSVPTWASILAVIVAGTLSYQAFKFNRS
ncbi:MAG: hypothetical protein Q7R75_02315 [bacterium]|nr:hypothetical protein [bacterium]